VPGSKIADSGEAADLGFEGGGFLSKNYGFLTLWQRDATYIERLNGTVAYYSGQGLTPALRVRNRPRSANPFPASRQSLAAAHPAGRG
jgi:hypothetical protein